MPEFTALTQNNLPTVTAFVSYSHKDREFGRQTKAVLNDVGIPSFLAHDDLETSEAWQHRILDELRSCDIFVPLLSRNFVASDWAPTGSRVYCITPRSYYRTIVYRWNHAVRVLFTYSEQPHFSRWCNPRSSR